MSRVACCLIFVGSLVGVPGNAWSDDGSQLGTLSDKKARESASAAFTSEAPPMELRLPQGKTAIEVLDRNVVVPGGNEEPVVAKVYLELGGHYVVLMPNGSLLSVEKRLTTQTDRPFEPISRDEMEAQLKEFFPGFKTRVTRHYVCAYRTSDQFCKSKMKILETMYPMLISYFRRQKLAPKEAGFPLVVIMFATKQEFQAYRKMPEGMLAYYNGINNWVCLYQRSDVTTDAPLIAAKQSVSTVAHEGVHQILHNIGVQKRLANWPLWISEGLAEYFAPTSSGLRSKWKGVGRPNELRMRELFRHLRQLRQYGDGSLIEKVVTAREFESVDYAVSWTLVHLLLTKHKTEFRNYLKEVAQDLPLEQPDNELQRFGKHFGYSLVKLEQEMLQHLKSLPYEDPVVNQPYFLVTAISGKTKHATITSSLNHNEAKKSLFRKFSVKARPGIVYQIRAFPNQRAAAIAMQLFMTRFPAE